MIANGNSELLLALDQSFARFAPRPALRREGGSDGSYELTYAEVRGRIAGMAAALRAAGVAPGRRVALLCENRPEYVIALLASWHAGATVVPLDTKLGTSELSVLVGHARPMIVLTSIAHRERACEVAHGARVVVLDDAPLVLATLIAPEPRPSEDVALVIYTSGTTGEPKGVAITFGNLLHQVRAVDAAIGPQGRERFLSLLPLCHLYELICGLLVPMSRGAVISYPATETLLPAELARLMKSRRITSIVGVPLLYRALQRGIDLQLRRSSALVRAVVAAIGALAAVLPIPAVRRALYAPVLRAFGGKLHQLYSGGAALDPDVARRFERMGLRILEGYGLSETSPVIATNTPRSYRLGSVGRPLPGVEVRISSEGEIQTRGPHVMRGYVGRPDLTDAVIDRDGWFSTGDLGRLDPDGYLHVTGRAKDVIVLGGGKKVYPDEVEQVLAQHAGFAEVCVLGVAARHGNEDVCAVVVPAPGCEELDAEAEIARALSSVAVFKRPTRVVVRREPIPRTTTRKAKRAALGAWVTSQEREAA